MKFELNEYHRNVSDEELVADVKRVAEKLGKNTLTGDEYLLHGKYHLSTVRRRLGQGSWRRVLEQCSLDARGQGHHFKYDLSDVDVANDLKRVAEIIKAKSLTAHEYSLYGKHHADTLRRKYGSWNKVLELAGMEPIQNRNFSNEDLFEEIERIWIMLGRQPTATDIKNGISKYSLNSYARRFGGWRKALEAFVNFINAEDSPQESSDMVANEDSVVTDPIGEKIIIHKTPRDINLRLRFKVFLRDHFKCCSCGASPAKDPAVVLHVDHIMPWSKGGETILENLQTLCSKCNLGKSDLL